MSARRAATRRVLRSGPTLIDMDRADIPPVVVEEVSGDEDAERTAKGVWKAREGPAAEVLANEECDAAESERACLETARRTEDMVVVGVVCVTSLSGATTTAGVVVVGGRVVRLVRRAWGCLGGKGGRDVGKRSGHGWGFWGEARVSSRLGMDD